VIDEREREREREKEAGREKGLKKKEYQFRAFIVSRLLHSKSFIEYVSKSTAYELTN